MPNHKMTKRHFLNKNNLIDSYVFVLQHHEYNADLRGVIIRALQEKYNEFFNRKNLNEEVKHKLLSEIELEIMCKVMELTESLASVCNALAGDERKIKEYIVDFQADAVNKFYKNIRKNNAFYYKLFTYPGINKLPISAKEKKFLKRLYFCNIEVIKKLFMIIRKFRKINTTAYNKNRHSRPRLIGFETKDSDYYAFTNIMSRRKTKTRKKVANTFLLHGKPILDKYVELANMIILLQKDLLGNRIHYFDTEGFKMPVRTIYLGLSQESEKIIEKINNSCSKGVSRNKINIEFRMKINRRKLQRRIDFYEKEFLSIKKGKDNKLEEYAKQITAAS